MNKTNGRLLYESLLTKVSTEEGNDNSEDYQLLSVFEMLWNVENNIENNSEIEKNFKGHALTIKEEFLEPVDNCCKLIQICTQVRRLAS